MSLKGWAKFLLKVPFLAVLGAFLITITVIVGVGLFSPLLAPVVGGLVLLAYVRFLPYQIWGAFSWKTVGVGALSWIVAFPLSAGVGAVIAMALGPFDTEQAAVEQIQKAQGHPMQVALLLFSAVLVAPIVEELLFRGFLQTWFKRYLSKIWAILFSAGLFAAVHFSLSQGKLNYQLIPVLFTLGIFLGALYDWRKSLWAPIALHATFNAISAGALLAPIS